VALQYTESKELTKIHLLSKNIRITLNFYIKNYFFDMATLLAFNIKTLEMNENRHKPLTIDHA
jgi:hypothetical protein